MSFNFNGITSTNVTINGAVAAMPLPASTQTIINVSTTGNGVVQDAYTVPAGKTFYLFGASITNAGGDRLLQIFKTNGSTELIRIQSTQNLANWLILNMPFSSSVPIWAYAAGEIVKCKCTDTIDYNINGILA